MVLDLLFPNRCIGCNQIIGAEEIICAGCMAQVDFVHAGWGESGALKQRCRLLFPVENAFALMKFHHESLSRKIVHRLKYGGHEKTGKILAKWIAERLDFGDDRPNLFTTVPLHPKKLRKRGYNQLHLFGDTLAESYKIPCEHQLLQRNRHTEAQAKKDKMHRLEGQNPFSLRQKISGKHILLIDDVFTTGNTVAGIAWELIRQNNRVSILVMAYDE